MKKILMTLFLCLGMSSWGVAAVTPGQSAPDFSLTDTNGNAHTLSDYQGNYVVLEWLNHDCPFIKKHYRSGNMQALQKEYGAKDIVWFSIGSSGPGKQGHYSSAEWNEKTAKEGASPKAVLIDADGTVGKLFGAKTTPHMFIIDPKGTLIYQGAIDNIPSADSADVADAENYVRSVLDAAMSGEPAPIESTKSYGCSVKYADA